MPSMIIELKCLLYNLELVVGLPSKQNILSQIGEKVNTHYDYPKPFIWRP